MVVVDGKAFEAHLPKLALSVSQKALSIVSYFTVVCGGSSSIQEPKNGSNTPNWSNVKLNWLC